MPTEVRSTPRRTFITARLYTVYTNFGAIYWLNKQSASGTSAWDINVSTFDFNSFNNNAFLVSDWGAGDVSDACFVRLVE